MSKTPLTTAAAAVRLAEALNLSDDLTCAAAEPLIPMLLDAESTGEDVAQTPTYAALLNHLDHCANCLSLYEQLAEDYAAVMGASEVLPSVAPTPPVFFATPIPKGDHVLLHLVRGLVRRFTLTFDLPRLAPALATLGGSQRRLFSDHLGEVAGTPLLSLTVGQDAAGMWLQVVVHESGQPITWRLHLELGAQTLTATTDARGVARFILPPDVPLGEVRLHCEELPAGSQDE